MQINFIKWIKTCSMLLCTLIVSTALANACPTNAPAPMLQCIADQMIAGLKANQATLRTKPQIVYQLAYKYVVPNADLDEMAKHVIPPHIWNSATQAQRNQFKSAFTRTLIRTYASALTSYEDEAVKVYPPRSSGSKIQVNSVITGSGNNINVSYILIRSGGRLRLYDMSVEGVSMLESFRAQFADILAQGNMAQLLQRLGSHNNR